MQLSIIVPTYNVEHYLANCLDSLLGQDIDNNTYEIIIVNDGSTDKSKDIAIEYSEKYGNVLVHNQINQGLSAARNTGMGLAKGRYIYFIDSDDYIARNTLGYIMKLLEQHDLDVLGLHTSTTTDFENKETANREIMGREELKVTDGISFIAEHNYLNNVWWYFIRRQYLMDSKLMFPVGRFVEDANFTAQLLVNAGRIAQSSLDFYRYLIRSNSIMRRRSKEHNRKMIADYEKNVYDYEPIIQSLRQRTHPQLKNAVRRLEARQQAFVFFLIVRCVKYSMPWKELKAILDGFRAIGIYPMNKFIGKDYHKVQFRFLSQVMNNKFLLYTSLQISPILNKFYPIE